MTAVAPSATSAQTKARIDRENIIAFLALMQYNCIRI